MKRLRRWVPLIAMLALAISLACFPASAADEIAGADFNNGTMHWEISADGVLSITGTGNMPDYSETVNAPWYAYRSQIGSIVVGEGVTGIGSYAFYQCNQAVTVSLPDTLEKLGAYCFSGCKMLKAAVIPEGISEIPSDCFYECFALETVELPDSIRSFGSSAFYLCGSLREIEIPEGVTALNASNLFRGCNALQSIALPSTLEEIGGTYAFSNTSISKIFFHGSLEQWLSMKFSYGESAGLPMKSACSLYLNGEKLTSLTIPAGTTGIPAYAFQNVNFNSVTIPDSVQTVGTNAFANCASLRKVYFVGDQSKWSTIAWNTGNDALIDAPRVYVASFDEVCTVTVGAAEHGTVQVSDSSCIAGDTVQITAVPEPGYRLTAILVNGVPITGSSFVAEADTDYTVTAEFAFYMDVADYGTCGANLEWVLYENNELVISGTGVMTSAPWNKYCNIIETITIGEGVTSIRYSAFEGCHLVQEIVLPDSIETIEECAFESCSSLRTVSLPANLSVIENRIFRRDSLETLIYRGDAAGWLQVDFNDSILECVQTLYFGDEAVTELIVPDGVTEIPANAFCGYEGLTAVSLSDSVKTIGYSAFEDCSGLETVVFPASVETIEDSAFSGCDLTYAEFLGDAPVVGSYSFGSTNREDSTVLYYHAGTNGWTSPKWNGYYAACVEAFEEYSALDADNRNAQGILFQLNATAKTATVGDGSTTNNNAGYYGAQKGAVVIPDVVTKDGVAYRVIGINQYAFRGNRHVTSVSIGAGVTSVIPTAFAGCPNLREITVAAENEFYSSADGVLYDAEKLYLYVYPGGKTDAAFTVPQTVKTIGKYAFYDNEHLNRLVVGTNVTAIYEAAFCGVTNLSEITLPFIGTKAEETEEYVYFSNAFASGYYGDDPTESGLRWNASAGKNVPYYGNLKKVTILGGGLYDEAFSSCKSLQEIVLPETPESIPNRCFYECESLERLLFADAGTTCEQGELVLPEGVVRIETSAFNGCKRITAVRLPASLSQIDSSAFSSAGVEEFSVAAGNQNFSADKWGVLYSADKKTLVQYPSCRKWPYYNVQAGTESINRGAFSSCENLVNLYFPNSVQTFDRRAIESCPNLTVCCYMGSAAYQYALEQGLTAWYMDNKTLQGIKVYSLPEQTVQLQGQVDLQGLYVVGNYQGKELQIDDYTLDYDQSASGVKTVAVSYLGKTDTFQMALFTADEGNLISFSFDQELNGKTALIALYEGTDKMIQTKTAIIWDGKAQIGVSDSIYSRVKSAKLFVLDAKHYAPATAAQQQYIG